MDPIRIANASGFYGDRFTAPMEMVRGGQIHVLTGDYLAELTMAILTRQRQQDNTRGYAATFPKQMQAIMEECLERGIKVVSNAGGMNPEGLAAALAQMADEMGLNPLIAYVEGDNLLPRLPALQAQGEPLAHLETGQSLAEAGVQAVSANAYLGGWGIAEALRQGADIVVTGRVADAALVVGPAAWHFGWQRGDWDALAGAVVAGHIIECGPQCTGGNYSFIDEVPTFKEIGFPVAEVYADGSAVITKHHGTGGLVSIGTVTAQILYEIQSERYLTPDVTARFDTIALNQIGHDRVRVSGVKGEPPPPTSKVTINTFGGFRNTMSVVLPGLDVAEKARIVEDVLFGSLGGKEAFETADVQLIRSDKADPPTNEEACAYLKITVMDSDAAKVGRFFSSKVVELALANIPGFNLTSPPGDGAPFIRHWPALVSSHHITQHVFVNGQHTAVPTTWVKAAASPHSIPVVPPTPLPTAEAVRLPFGRLFGTRSGDKGGNANLGVWARDKVGYAFLYHFLTVAKLKELLKDTAEFEIDRYLLPNLHAINFVIHGILGDGVAASVRSDAQAKTLGEYLRARVIDVPLPLLSH